MNNQIPDWAQELMEAISGAIEFKGFASMEGYYSKADENPWGVDLIQLAPAILEIEEAGENDGENIYGILHNVDLLAAQEAFDRVTGLSFGFENDGQPTITLEGEVKGQEVVIILYTLPFEGAEPDGKLDLLSPDGPHFKFYEDDEEDQEDDLPDLDLP